MTVSSWKAASGTARAAPAIVARHAELQQVLDEWAGVLAAEAARGGRVRPAGNLLRAFLADEVLPHARAEERALYPVGKRDPRTGLLVQALVSEHRALASRAERLATQTEPVAASAAAEAIRALFASPAAQESGLLLPALERSRADLAALLARGGRLAGSR